MTCFTKLNTRYTFILEKLIVLQLHTRLPAHQVVQFRYCAHKTQSLSELQPVRTLHHVHVRSIINYLHIYAEVFQVISSLQVSR